MTIENWLTVALIISTLIATVAAPIVAAVVVPRINQPRATPVASHPKQGTKRKAASVMARLGSSPWIFPPMLLMNSIYRVHQDMNHAPPLTTPVVLMICLGVAQGGAAIAFFGINLLFRLIEHHVKAQQVISEMIVDSQHHIADRMIEAIRHGAPGSPE